MAFDYSKLNGKIKERFGTQSAFACALGLSSTSLSKKIHGKTQFTQNEMLTAAKLLNIDDVNDYFFTEKVKEV